MGKFARTQARMMEEPQRSSSACRCGLLAYAKAHAGRAWMRLPSHDDVFEGHGFRELIAATSAAGTTYHSQPYRNRKVLATRAAATLELIRQM